MQFQPSGSNRWHLDPSPYDFEEDPATNFKKSMCYDQPPEPTIREEEKPDSISTTPERLDKFLKETNIL